MVRIEGKLGRIPAKSVVILEVPVEEDWIKIVADFLRLRQSDSGIYVSSNRTVNALVEELRVYKFDLSQALEANKIYVVDLVSRSVGSREMKGCIYVASPSELSATQMAIEKGVEQIKSHGGASWLLLDSLSTLLVFNGSGALLSFLHFLTSRLRAIGFSGVILTLEGSVEQSILATIRQFCDELIRP